MFFQHAPEVEEGGFIGNPIQTQPGKLTKDHCFVQRFLHRRIAAADLGFVRKEMSQTPHGTSQRDHSGIAFRELVEACHDPAILFQPAKHALDDIALLVLRPIK